MLDKDPQTRMSIEGMKEHNWLTQRGEYKWDSETFELVEVSPQEIQNAVRRDPSFAMVRL